MYLRRNNARTDNKTNFVGSVKSQKKEEKIGGNDFTCFLLARKQRKNFNFIIKERAYGSTEKR